MDSNSREMLTGVQRPRPALQALCWLLAAVLPCAALAQPQVGAIEALPEPPLVTGQAALLSVQASEPGGLALQYRWDFGDGTPRTAWSSTPEASHAWQQAGVYGVLVQVRDAAQRVASATRTLVVHQPAAAPSRHSTSLLLHPSRRELWVANADHGSVSVLDPDALVRLEEIAVGRTPVSLSVDGAGQLWVALQDDDRLVRIDPASRAITASLPLGHGARPAALVIAADGNTGYVSLSGPGQLQRFAALTATLDTRLAVGPHLAALALAGTQDALYAARLVSGDGGGTVWRIDLPTFDAATPILLPIDSSSPDSGTAARGLPNTIGALALADGGTQLFYGGKKDNVLRGLHRDGQPLTFETLIRSLLGRIDTATASEVVARRMDLDNAGRVSALLLAPGASHLFLAQETNNRVLVLDPWQRSELARIAVGRAPRGLALDAGTGRLFVQGFLSRTVEAFDVAAVLDGGSVVPPALAAIEVSALEPLAPQVLAGKRVFYNADDIRMSQDGYTACGACHLDGGHDGRSWDFSQLGEGLRNTTSLRGNAGMGRGLVHWSGNFDEIQDFEAPIRNLFGGIGFLDDADFALTAAALGTPKAGRNADLDALAAYVASLVEDERSPHRAADGSLTAEGAAGRVLFEQLACQRCHAGADFTDSASGLRHDVGTLSAASGTRLGAPLLALDTPTLRGLSASAPYLHDGSAPTLEDVLVARNDGSHGEVASLQVAERTQLVAFLSQIDAMEPAVGLAMELQLASPPAGARLPPGQAVTLAIASDLPGVTQVDYFLDGALVASADAAPFSAQWTPAGTGMGALQARVRHDGGRFTTLSAAHPVELLGTQIFDDGFDPL